MRKGEIHSTSYFCSGASATSCFLASALARAISTASAAAASMPPARQIVGGGEAPAAAVEHADAEPERNGAGHLADFSVLGGDVALLGLDQAHIGVGNAAAHGGIERIQRSLFHLGVISPPSLSCSPEAVRGKRVE